MDRWSHAGVTRPTRTTFASKNGVRHSFFIPLISILAKESTVVSKKFHLFRFFLPIFGGEMGHCGTEYVNCGEANSVSDLPEWSRSADLTRP